MKIIDLIQQNQNDIQISLEYFPPKTPQGINNLNQRVDKMINDIQPIFIDLTWGAGGSSSHQITRQLTQKWHQDFSIPVNMHLTCTNMTLDYLDEILDELYYKDIQNVVALRGDECNPDTDSKLTCGLDLVEYMRDKYGDYFCITVAGYPEGHPDLFKEVDDENLLSDTEKERMVEYDDIKYVCSDEKYKDSLNYLRRKSDKADLIITQLFFDCDLYLKFVGDCREIGIKCPILPGIMLIQNYTGFKKMTKFCKTKVPDEISLEIEKLKDNQDDILKYGIELGQRMSKKLLGEGVKNLHFYTLNREEPITGILKIFKNK